MALGDAVLMVRAKNHHFDKSLEGEQMSIVKWDHVAVSFYDAVTGEALLFPTLILETHIEERLGHGNSLLGFQSRRLCILDGLPSTM